VRYDESTSTHLGEGAELIGERYRDDLRRLADEAEGRPGRLEQLLTEFPRIGPTGAQIFCREAQGVWPWLRPYFDQRALSGAEQAGLPTDPRAPRGRSPGCRCGSPGWAMAGAARQWNSGRTCSRQPRKKLSWSDPTCWT
jgi:hypothetical protein